MADINRAEDYFRRSKDRSGDTKLLARGLLHLIKHLGLDKGTDFSRAKEILDRAWKKAGNERQIAEALFLIARGIKNDGKKGKRVKSSVERDEFGLIKGLDVIGEHSED